MEEIIMTQTIIKDEEKTVNTSKEVYFSEILQEIQQIPREHWSNLLQILRAFREVTNPSTEKPLNNVKNDLLVVDPSEQKKKNQAALELLRRWEEDSDDEQEQKEAWEILSKAFDIND